MARSVAGRVARILVERDDALAGVVQVGVDLGHRLFRIAGLDGGDDGRVFGCDRLRVQQRRAKIVCTLGPATAGAERLAQLVAAGMDIARLNFSHGDRSDHETTYRTVRTVADEAGRAVGVLADLQGPKIRLGRFADGPVEWHPGGAVRITVDDVPGTRAWVSTTYAGLAADARPGDSVLVDDGKLGLRVLDAALARWADVVERIVGSQGQPPRRQPGAGASGGVGFAAIAALGAELQSGIQLVLDLVRFTDHLAGARLVVTGEGSLDEQTLHGKAPAGVAAATAMAGVPVVTVSGRLALTPDALRAAGIWQAYALTHLQPDEQRCVRDAGPLLEALAGHLARDWLAQT